MLTGFLRTIVLFFVTAVVLRLMGKRQLAQLQPYEVVITLMISDLATLPMADSAAERRGFDFDAAAGAQPAQRAFVCKPEDAADHLRQTERVGARRQNLRKRAGETLL